MTRHIATATLVVPDYDEAIGFYCGALGFELLEDTALPDGKRWVRVAPGPSGAALLLARADTDEQRNAIGNQTGGRVSFFLQTDDFDRDCARYAAAGVAFLEDPRQEAYGKVAVFRDPFGNKWDLIQPA
ncbi:VOC family protein [Oricola cellulosilytica]|uniref:VOC family protein n=1 Tax=Oricola cellulosilytica TaxID=1429082 RepID=A0A4R0PJU8_9HYPH|nr:VOC family protein [Oricola cellulosilytica]TCD15939.1 VOC family protein [Oricola cellulosilytica]